MWMYCRWISIGVHCIYIFVSIVIRLDRYIILGNHHDSWVFGAIDPLSGSAALTEIIRVLGNMLKQGRLHNFVEITLNWTSLKLYFKMHHTLYMLYKYYLISYSCVMYYVFNVDIFDWDMFWNCSNTDWDNCTRRRSWLLLDFVARC